jgi:hypothetical protein
MQLADAVVATGHRLEKRGVAWHCLDCSLKIPCKHLRKFAAAPTRCTLGTTTLSQQSVMLQGMCRVLGEQPIIHGVLCHSSHLLYSYRGIVWCSKCGNMAVHRPTGLKRQCKGTKNARGKLQAERLFRGVLPHAGMQWPDTNPLG